jgi:Uma2 family endonuclease
MTILETPPVHRTDPRQGFWDFVETRPEKEKWELIEGQIVMQAQPNLVHQFICSTLQRHLDDGLRRIGSPRVTLQNPAVDLWPVRDGHIYVPDVAVLDLADIEAGLNAVERCYLAAEILSPSDHRKLPSTRQKKIDVKLAGYEALLLCEAVLLIELKSRALTLSVRNGEIWTCTRLTGDDRLVLPGFGLDCAVTDLYDRTPVPRG